MLGRRREARGYGAAPKPQLFVEACQAFLDGGREWAIIRVFCAPLLARNRDAKVAGQHVTICNCLG